MFLESLGTVIVGVRSLLRRTCDVIWLKIKDFNVTLENYHYNIYKKSNMLTDESLQDPTFPTVHIFASDCTVCH